MNQWLPAHLSASQIVACLGLISDTHMPERWPTLPPALFDVFQGVDLLLHAGDVGELWVLDQLSTIAPVIAVHGNDDTQAAQDYLPAQQLITIGGQRMLLWHSHYPDRQAELDARRSDDLPSKLARIADTAKAMGAAAAVFGHWHIPLTVHINGVLVINPGAIASGNHFLRQLVQTVALLFVSVDGRCTIVHIDLAHPTQPYSLPFDIEAGFTRNSHHFNTSILAPDLAALDRQAFWHLINSSPPLRAAYVRVCHRCWAGELTLMTSATLLAEVQQDKTISPALKTQLEAYLADKKHEREN